MRSYEKIVSEIDSEMVILEERESELEEEKIGSTRRRLIGDHDGWPSDEQMEYFKRGGR